MPKFELGFAYRGSTAPEVKEVVEADSLREAMLSLIDDHGGAAAVLVTYAHHFPDPEPPQPPVERCLDACNDAKPFLLAAR